MKKSKLVEQLKFIRICAIKADIWDHVFLGYGTMLGAVMERGIIGNDADADICLMADRFTKDQEDVFYRALWDEGLFEHRHREQRRSDTGRLLWCSVKKFKSGMKNCIWFQFPHNGFYWHSKGPDWVKKIGGRLEPAFNSGEAVAKGIPAGYFDEFSEVDWYGQPWKIPTSYGTCLDFYYPKWLVPAGGCSHSQYILTVDKWKNEQTWQIRKRGQNAAD
jgi:hypothetical protein